MNEKRVLAGIVCISLILVLSVSFVSAGFFSDFLQDFKDWISKKIVKEDGLVKDDDLVKKEPQIVEINCSDSDNRNDIYNKRTCINGDGENSECVYGQNDVPCPRRIQLPFFNIYNLIGTIVLIILIYYILSLKKKRRAGRKRKKR